MSGKEMCLLRREFDGPSHSESLWRALDLKLRRREVTQTTLYFQIEDLYWGMEQYGRSANRNTGAPHFETRFLSCL